MFKRLKWFLLPPILLGLGLVACGGPQQTQDYYKPATEVLASGNVLFCPSRGELKVTKNGTKTVEGTMTCQKVDAGLAYSDVIDTDQVEFAAPTDQIIFNLVNVHYGWGIVTDDGGNLLQIFEQGDAGWIHIHWPLSEETTEE